jgi:hypothetical protein
MKPILRHAHKLIVWYSLIFSPLTAFYFYWFSRHGQEPPQEGIFGIINNLGFIWVLSLIYVFLALLFYKNFRESLLTRLIGLREKDEQDRLVTGQSARAAFLLMLAVQIALLVLSLTNVNVIKNPDGHGTVSIGMGFSSEQLNIYSLPAKTEVSLPPGALHIQGYLLPPNIAPILMLLILTQIGALKLFARRGKYCP